MSNTILGISAFYHDSAAALLKNGEPISAAQEERFTRKKHDASFPLHAIQYCLQSGGISLEAVDAVVFYEKPLLKFERLLETYSVFAPKGIRSFLLSMPIWLKEKLFLKRLIKTELNKIQKMRRPTYKLLFSEHHLSHSASAFYPSPFDDAAILTIDGVGEWATASISHGTGKDIRMLKELNFPHSVGLLYSAFTYYLGFKVNSGEYKLMGLAPYGNPAATEKYKMAIYENILDVREDGSIWLNQDWFDYSIGLKMTKNKKWQALFGFPKRDPEAELEQHHCDLALAIQEITEDIVVKMGQTAKKITRAKNLCMAGGVALNCVANSKLLNTKIFDQIWIQPAAGDAGGALGAAMAVQYMYYDCERKIESPSDKMQGAYLGPSFSEPKILEMADNCGASYTLFKDFDALCEKVAEWLANGMVVGWFQGKMEWGPRALGNRSILASPTDQEMQKRLNLKIKFRESFRPFAPAVLYEDLQEYFDMERISPYMLLTALVKKEKRNPLPDNYHHLSIKEKLYHIRSDIPAVTHLDFSARLQTVHKETNPHFWKLINAFKTKTGRGVVVNTSFNVRGEPIVCTPEEAYRCFIRTEMDCLVIGNFLFSKQNQPKWQDDKEWQIEYTLD